LNKREFLKYLGLFSLGLLSFPFLKTLTFLSKPLPKKIYLSKEELLKVKEIYFGEEFLLVKKGSEYVAFSRKCPHLGCKLNYDPEKEQIVCPCHKSKFTLLGKYLEGPAKKDLRELKIELSDEGLTLELS
jgi:Rieske Fe-S protein